MVINIIVSPGKEDLMDINEAASFMRLCVPKFNDLVKRSDIPFVQYPGMKKKLYRREDLEKVINDNKIVPIKFEIEDIPGDEPNMANKSLKENKKVTKKTIQRWVRELNQRSKK